jgi:hypothetical protein
MLIEDILSEQKNVQNAQMNLEDQTLVLESETADTTELLTSLNETLKSYGYEVSPMENLTK